MLLRAAFDSLTRISDEFAAGQFATRKILALWNEHVRIPLEAKAAGVTEGMLQRAASNLEITYLVRLFADFEGILRDYWENGMGRTTEPPMQQLLDAIAADRTMNAADLAAAHAIREFRNDVIHESLRLRRYTFAFCVRCLGSYLRWLPQTW